MVVASRKRLKDAGDGQAGLDIAREVFEINSLNVSNLAVIPAPDTINWNHPILDIAISPDGNHLAVVGGKPGNTIPTRTRLFLSDWDSVDRVRRKPSVSWMVTATSSAPSRFSTEANRSPPPATTGFSDSGRCLWRNSNGGEAGSPERVDPGVQRRFTARFGPARPRPRRHPLPGRRDRSRRTAGRRSSRPWPCARSATA